MQNIYNHVSVQRDQKWRGRIQALPCSLFQDLEVLDISFHCHNVVVMFFLSLLYILDGDKRCFLRKDYHTSVRLVSTIFVKCSCLLGSSKKVMNLKSKQRPYIIETMHSHTLPM